MLLTSYALDFEEKFMPTQEPVAITSSFKMPRVITGFILLFSITVLLLPPTIKGVLADNDNNDDHDIKLGNTGVEVGGDITRFSGHVIYGTPQDDVIFGGGHEDKINGDFGNDWLKGNGGDDVIQGGGGSDKIYGNDGNDFLLGGFGDDLIVGGNGDNSLLGGPDDDTLVGGPGKDYFNCGDGQDQIVDFKSSQGDTKTQDCEVISTD